nr:type II toxin-antitoxin system RelE/ParE family toxin [Ramlibacter albus]
MAERDVESAIDYYREQAGVPVALAFVEAVEVALRHISRNPAMGSPRLGHELGIPGLRSWPLNRFPYLVFYFEKPHEVDVWRVLHMAMDAGHWLQ